jgi:hypothetical protein
VKKREEKTGFVKVPSTADGNTIRPLFESPGGPIMAPEGLTLEGRRLQ